MTDYATADLFTRLYLYGNHSGAGGAYVMPELLTDRLRNLSPTATGATVEIAASAYMSGFGHYAVPARAKFVQDFFNGAVTLAAGTYTVAQLKATHSANDFRFSFNHAQVDIGSSLYMERAFVFGHAGFFLTDDTKFTVGAGGALSMSDVRVMPVPDNFDFESTGLAQYLNDYYLQPTIDPSEIGRVVSIVYTGTVSATTYSAQSFATDIDRISTWDSSSAAAALVIGANIADFVDLLRQDGAFENVRDGADIIYDGQGENNLEIRSLLKPGIFIGGDGNDTIEGGAFSDIAYGGADNDRFVASAGNDEIWGGDEEGKAAYSDSDTVDYSAMASPIDIIVSGSGNQATISVSKGQAGGTDSLHSIEIIVATSGRDVFTFGGAFDSGYALAIDAHGGQSQDDMLNFAGMGSGFTYLPDGSDYILTSRAGNGHAGGGHITLQNFHTQIVGSAHDDIITDEADGKKTINGGDGDDVITVGGEAGNAMIRGGDGSDILTGGDGNDRIIGDDGGTNETNQMSGGEGADYIFSQSHLDSVDGGDGHDYLQVANGNTNLTMIRGGAGNDFIAAAGGMLLFGAADGNDAVSHGLSSGVIPINIFLEGMTTDDITLIWDVTLDNIGTFYGIGDMVLLVNSTGASIFIPQVGGYALTDENTSEHVGQFWFGFSFELEPAAAWADVAVQIGGVSQYNHALEDYQEATAGDPEANDGTPGADDLAGSPGDDSIDGGGGDDSFHGSGGNDTIDGGSGSDILNLFGARFDFVITRNSATGDITLEDETGLEGRLTVKSVEKIYFATDNEEYETGDLVGFWGTTGDDALVQGNARDNLIHGLAGNDVLRGLDGDDSLYGDEGEDTLEGGAGNDIYHVDHGSDTVTEAVAGGSDTIITNVGYTLAAGQEIELLRTYGSATAYAVDLTGNEFANTIVGNAAANAIDGKGGADAMWGYGGNDILYVDNAGDTVIEAAGGGADTVISNVSYTLAAGQEIELLRTYGSATTAAINLTGNAFANTLAGNAAANVLDGKGGADVMWGHAGNDTYYVDNAADSAIEAVGGGSDTVIANVSYTLAAGREIETLRTFGSATTNAVDFTGNELANTLVGNAAANQLDGKGGADAMWGYGGADTFAFTTALDGGNIDAIIDFAAGTDTIALDDAIFAAVGAALDASEFRIGTAAADADDRIVYNSATGQLFYDADGAGGAAQVQFATLSGAPAIAAGDFVVI